MGIRDFFSDKNPLWKGSKAIAKGLGSAVGYQTTGGDNSDYAKNRLVKTVRDAQAAGIHPLYAIGSGGFTPSPQMVGGNDFSGVLDGVRQAASLAHGFSSEQAAKASAGLETRVAESVIRRNDAAAGLDNTQAALAASNDAMNLAELQQRTRDKIGVMLDDKLSDNSGTVWGPKSYPQAMIEVQFPNGKRMFIPNQNVMETGELLGAGVGAAGAVTSLMDWIRKTVPQMSTPPKKGSGAYQYPYKK
ncbi:MAG: DNA pilot protein [Microvirus sp.]|nr:MAG: DNA pilot protein [Microvirus sp.]